MNKFFTFILFVCCYTALGQGLLNDKAYIVVTSGTTVNIVDGTARGNFTNQNSANTVIDGEMRLEGNFTNSTSATINASTSGKVTFNGTITQNLSSYNSLSFYKLEENNSVGANSDGLAIDNNVNVLNEFTMTRGIINIGSKDITLGTASSSPGTLIWSDGFIYGTGKFTRWFNENDPIAIGDVKGLFPMGKPYITSAGPPPIVDPSNYHPFWFGCSGFITPGGGGTISVSHNPPLTNNFTVSDFNDPTWGTGTSVVALSNAAWIVTSTISIDGDNGFVRFGGYGFGGPANVLDVNASIYEWGNTPPPAGLKGKVSGTYQLSTAISPDYLVVNRSNIQSGGGDDCLNKEWHIGTKDKNNTPLPVSLIDFTANCDNVFVTIQWTTASETNNDFFTIERSLDGIQWISVATIPGAGNSNQIHNYGFSDENAVDYNMYYRLKQTDFDGNVKSFAPVTVNCASQSDLLVNVFPNPFKDEVTLSISNLNFAGAQVNVFDIVGNKIAERTFNDIQNHALQTTFDLGGLAGGMYFVEVRAAGFSKNIKIVKN